MPPITRKRNRLLRRDQFVCRMLGSWTAPRSGTCTIEGEQLTVSEGHPWAHQGYQGKDVGGDFYTIQRRYGDGRSSLNNPQPQYVFGKPSDSYYYYGPLYAVQPQVVGTGHTYYGAHRINSNVFPPDLSYSNEILDGLGTTAIANCKPTNSPADLAVGLGELFNEGIPSLVGASLWSSRAKGLKSYGSAAGDEHLNLQFGWLPFVSEIKNAAVAIRNRNELMKQYERDSGRLVRREYYYPLVRETETVELPSAEVYMPQRVLLGGWYTNGSASRVRGFREREITRKIWFKGAFTYYLPNDYDSRKKMDRAATFASEILGLEITPDTIWNLTPWSWAIDWVTNQGDVISNISDFAADGLVMPYGYLMENTIIKDTYTTTGAELLGYGPVTLRNTFITEVKKRRRATPFGFGFDMGSLDPRKAAIIAALGISRVPR